MVLQEEENPSDTPVPSHAEEAAAVAAVLQHVGGGLDGLDDLDECVPPSEGVDEADLEAECARLRGRVVELEAHELRRSECVCCVVRWEK